MKSKESDSFPFSQSFRTKTQKAISLINRHQQQKYNFLKTLSSKKKFVSNNSDKSDEQFFSIIEVPQIQIQESVKIQILPQMDRIFKIHNPFLQNQTILDKNQISEEDQASQRSTIALKDSQLTLKKQQLRKNPNKSSINKSFELKSNLEVDESSCKLKIYIKNYRGSPSELYVYFENGQSIRDFNLHFHRYSISNEKILNISMHEFLNKKWIYIRIKTRTEISIFTMRVEHQSSSKTRLITDAAQVRQSPVDRQKLPELKLSQSLKLLKRNGSIDGKGVLNKHTSTSLHRLDKISSLQNQQLSPSSKQKNKEILEKLKKQEFKKQKLQEKKKHEQILRKKLAIEEAKQKQLKLKSKALQMKKLVDQYRIIHQEQNNYSKFLQPYLAAIMFLPKFNKICRQMIIERQNGMKMAWKTRVLTKRFTKIVKRKYIDCIQHIKSRKNRELISLISLTNLFAKILNKNCLQNASISVMSTFKLCKPGLILNQSFDYATNYRRSIRTIQRTWLNQYRARMEIFQMYVREQAQVLIKKYSYFKYIEHKFVNQNVAHELAYKYISEESSKLKYLFEDYNQKFKEIEEFRAMNKKITQFNSTALKKRQKPLLEVPKTPCFPSSRYFRNISFLKSMIRGWFQLEYRKWSKMNKAYLESLSSEKPKNVSPSKASSQKQVINTLEKSKSKDLSQS